MRANKRRDTAPELQLRRVLHAAGLRFRVDYPLPFDRRRRADIVFTRVGLYVFLDGCFWHGCPDHFIQPRTRHEFWASKISGNRDRDRDTTARLQRLGLTVLRIWEHEDLNMAAATIIEAYRSMAESK